MAVPDPSGTPPTHPPETGRADPLAAYRALERHCLRMLEAARHGDWSGVERLGRESRTLVAAARRRPDEPLDAPRRREKFRLLRSIVRIDAQVRHLSEPWSRTIDRMLSAPASPADEPGSGSTG
jgi:hypothetical protein